MINLEKKYSKLIIRLTVIAIFLFFVGYHVIGIIENHYYELKKSEALNMSESYANSITKTSQAYTIINELLEEKIEVASKMSSLEDLDLNSIDLEKLSEKLNVDKIYYYNEEGTIIRSNLDEYIGWKAYEGHPVYTFMTSDSNMFIEEGVRKDTEGSEYFKYGYYRLKSGGYI